MGISLLAGGILAGLVLGGLLGRLAGRAAERKAAWRTTELALAAASPDPLYEVDEIDVVVQFDETGSGVFSRRCTGLVPRYRLSDLVIPYRSTVAPPEATLGVPEISAVPGSQVRITFETTRADSRSVEGSVVIHGLPQEPEKIPGYVLRQTFQHAFLVERGRVQEAYRGDAWKREYTSTDVQVPTRILRLSVIFPASHAVLSDGPDLVVFLAGTELVNAIETERVASRFAAKEGRAELTVENPRPGARYAISWLPPARQAV